VERRAAVMLELVVALLIVIAGALLLYLEWWRSGELEDLNRRVDELELARRKRAATSTRKPATPEAPK
jgi:hypothetical protein